MQPSSLVWALCREFEGERLTAYRDIGGTWTNGVGRAHGVYPGQTIDIPTMQRWLSEDIGIAAAGVNHAIMASPLNQGQFDALTDFVFEFGAPKFNGSTLLALILRGDWDGAALEFPKWVHSNGTVVPQLQRRRAVEQALFLGEPRPPWTLGH